MRFGRTTKLTCRRDARTGKAQEKKKQNRAVNRRSGAAPGPAAHSQATRIRRRQGPNYARQRIRRFTLRQIHGGSVAFLDNLLVVEVDCQPALSRQLKHFFWPVDRETLSRHTLPRKPLHRCLDDDRSDAPDSSSRSTIPSAGVARPEAIVLLEQIDEQRPCSPITNIAPHADDVVSKVLVFGSAKRPLSFAPAGWPHATIPSRASAFIFHVVRLR